MLGAGKINGRGESAKLFRPSEAYVTTMDPDDVLYDGKPEPMPGDRFIEPASPFRKDLCGIRLDARTVVLDKYPEIFSPTQTDTDMSSGPLGRVVRQIPEQLEHILFVERKTFRGRDVRGYIQ